MTGSSGAASDRAREGPCARCIIGAVLGTAIAAAMLFVTVRLVSALVRGGFRRASG